MKEVTTKTHNKELGSFFKSLNEEWLKKYFVVEPIDNYVLSNPDKIIQAGGQIIYAILADEVVGCVALKQHDPGVFELTKMAVTAKYQAKGIGAKLMKSCLEEFMRLQGNKLYLESHSSLVNAIKLYQSYGFQQQPCPFTSEYQRSDFYMVYQPCN